MIWDKGPLGRKESTDNRCRHNFEVVLFFTRIASGYWYNQDALRLPLAGGQPYSVKSGYSQDHNKPGVLRRDGDRDFRIPSNPLGRIADAVWHIPPVVSPSASHSAPFPEELVRRALLLTAPPCDLPPVATVLDCYGGSGTVSVVAKQFGLKSIYIDANPSMRHRRSSACCTDAIPMSPSAIPMTWPMTMSQGRHTDTETEKRDN